MDIKAYRNKWGSQIHSFESNIDITLDDKINYCAKFIRAPKIKLLSNNVKILGMYRNEPVLVRNKKHLVSSFHPEMNDDTILHDYFIKMINE